MLFEDAVVEYMRDKERRLRGNTLEGYRSALKRHVPPAFGRRGKGFQDVQAGLPLDHAHVTSRRLDGERHAGDDDGRDVGGAVGAVHEAHASVGLDPDPSQHDALAVPGYHLTHAQHLALGGGPAA